jgi:hypothetical protein
MSTKSKAGSTTECPFCKFLFRGPAKFQHSLSEETFGNNSETRRVITISDSSSTLAFQTDEYLERVGDCHVCLVSHSRTDPQSLKRQGRCIAVVLISSNIEYPRVERRKYFDESWICGIGVLGGRYRLIPPFAQVKTLGNWLPLCEKKHFRCSVDDIATEATISRARHPFRLINTSGLVIVEVPSLQHHVYER